MSRYFKKMLTSSLAIMLLTLQPAHGASNYTSTEDLNAALDKVVTQAEVIANTSGDQKAAQKAMIEGIGAVNPTLSDLKNYARFKLSTNQFNKFDSEMRRIETQAARGQLAFNEKTVQAVSQRVFANVMNSGSAAISGQVYVQTTAIGLTITSAILFTMFVAKLANNPSEGFYIDLRRDREDSLRSTSDRVVRDQAEIDRAKGLISSGQTIEVIANSNGTLTARDLVKYVDDLKKTVLSNQQDMAKWQVEINRSYEDQTRSLDKRHDAAVYGWSSLGTGVLSTYLYIEGYGR